MRQIYHRHLDFLKECCDVFGGNILRETHINADGDMIALRQGMDRDCIEIYDLGDKVGFFAQMIPRTNNEEYVLAIAKSRRYGLGYVKWDDKYKKALESIFTTIQTKEQPIPEIIKILNRTLELNWAATSVDTTDLPEGSGRD